MTVAAPSLDEILNSTALWRGGAMAHAKESLPTGFDALDHALPGCGWPGGALTEILVTREGLGELQLVLPVLARLTADGERAAWVTPPHLPFAPALSAAGVNLEHLLVVRAPGQRDTLWAIEQVLRTGGCRLLLAWCREIRYAELRRLALAAETSSASLILFRPPQVASASSPAALRVLLQSAGEVLSLHILKRRGLPAAAPVLLALPRPSHAVDCTEISSSCAREPAVLRFRR